MNESKAPQHTSVELVFQLPDTSFCGDDFGGCTIGYVMGYFVPRTVFVVKEPRDNHMYGDRVTRLCPFIYYPADKWNKTDMYDAQIGLKRE